MPSLNASIDQAWQTDRWGEEYTASVPFDPAHPARGCLTVTVVCEGRPFLSADREYARHCLLVLMDHVDGIVALLRDLQHPEDLLWPGSAMADISLLLTAGNHETWTLSVNNAVDGSTIYADFFNGAVEDAWEAG